MLCEASAFFGAEEVFLSCVLWEEQREILFQRAFYRTRTLVKYLLSIIVLMLFTAPALAFENTDIETKVFNRVWEKFTAVSEDAIGLATSKDRNSRSALEVFTLREPKYARLLKKAQEILADSEAKAQFDAIDELTLKNRNLENEIISLKQARISAPQSSLNPLVKSKERIDKRLAKIPHEIEANKEEIVSLKSEIIDILGKNGVKITQEELNYFLISAEGSELVRLMNIASNMKKIQYVIERELQNDKHNVQLAKHYTGMYLISLESYLAAHDTALKKIPRYREKVRGIIKEAIKNTNEALSLKKQASDSELQSLEANVKINERVIAVGRMYDSLLQKREKILAASRRNVEKKVRLARNTYQTILNGSSLISLVNAEGGEFALLTNFEMPELKIIYDSAMLNAFIDIAEKIKSEE